MEFFFRWKLQDNYYTRSMEVYRNKSAYSGTAVNTKARGRYETGKSGAWKNGMSALILSIN